jgi:hypothetical protein
MIYLDEAGVRTKRNLRKFAHYEDNGVDFRRDSSLPNEKQLSVLNNNEEGQRP